jgi:hypothetical protein
MKSNTKKLLLGLGLAMIGNLSRAQGLDGIIVEKYYQANSADVSNASANGAITPLTTNSVTYRIYVDMAAGYKFNLLYGNAAHALTVNTTTAFFNDPTYGVSLNPNTVSSVNIRKNTAMLDSWFATGGAGGGYIGVQESLDSDGTVGHATGLLANNPGGCFGNPIMGSGGKDGFLPNTNPTPPFYVVPNALGLGTALDVLDQTNGGSILINAGSIAALGGIVGPTSDNRVLVAQFTTDGQLSFALNVQIQNIATGVSVNYVASAPTGAEQTHPSLTYVPNTPPTVSITSPTTGATWYTGSSQTITASASDVNGGTITQVEFFDGATSLGVDNTSPYSIAYTATAGAHSFTAVALDNECASTTSAAVSVTAVTNSAPSVSVSAPATAIEQDVVTISATASDAAPGSVASVQFLVDNVAIGTDNSAPYSITWTAVAGIHQIKAVATDDQGLTTNSSVSAINVALNTPPSVSITAPTGSESVIAPAAVNITANASDIDGTVTLVEFLVNGTVVGTDSSSPYAFSWTSTPGSKVFTVRATDDKNAQTVSSAVTLSIADPNALPYALDVVSEECNVNTYCMTLSAAVTSPVDNVKGYDVVINYDNTKVSPTGNVTLFSDLVSSSLIEETHLNNATNGTFTITINFKGTAPASSEFNGTGKVFCVEFQKISGFAPIDSAIFSTSFLQESYYTGVQQKAASAGKWKSFKNFSYDGKLRHWLNHQPISYNAALPNQYLITRVKGADTTTFVVNNAVSVTPNTAGVFTHDLNNGLGLSIERDINNTASVQMIVNANDAVLGKTLLLNDAATFTPSVYQIIALDVNLDGVVSAGDITQLRQRATLNIGQFIQAWNYDNAGVWNGQPSKDWIFVDSMRVQTNSAYQISSTFPNNDLIGYSKYKVPQVPFVIPARATNMANCPNLIAETYKGIMLGDVDGNYDVYTADGILKSTFGKVILDLDNATFNNGSIDVPVTFESTEPVNAIDLAFQFDESKFTFNDMVSVGTTTEGFAHFNEDDRTLRYTAFDVTYFDAGQTLATVTLNASISTIKEADFSNTLALLNGKPVELVFNKSALGVAMHDENFANIFPNPTQGALNIVSSQNAQVTVMSVTGQEVKEQFDINANEKVAIDMSMYANGVYFVKISNGQYSKTERVVVNK